MSLGSLCSVFQVEPKGFSLPDQSRCSTSSSTRQLRLRKEQQKLFLRGKKKRTRQPPRRWKVSLVYSQTLDDRHRNTGDRLRPDSTLPAELLPAKLLPAEPPLMMFQTTSRHQVALLSFCSSVNTDGQIILSILPGCNS